MAHPASEALNLLDEGVVLVDEAERIVLVNDYARRRLGFQPPPQLLSEAVGDERAAAWTTILGRVAAEGTFRGPAEVPSGKTVDVFATTRSEGGALLALRRRRPRPDDEPLIEAYARVLARFGIGLWRLDVREGDLWWSPKCFELTGLPPGPVSTASYLEHVHPEDQVHIGEHMSAVTSGTGEYAPCFRIPGPSGTRHLQDRCEILSRVESGAPSVAIGATLDRTPWIELEERAAALEEQLVEAHRLHDAGRLAGAVAHDLNNVMTVIVGSAELLSEVNPDGEDGVLLRDVLTAAYHASALSSRMVDFVRKSPLALEAIEMATFVREAGPFLRTMVSETVELAILEPDEPVWARGDRHRLEQVLFNLVLNAAEAITCEGRVEVAVREDEGRVILTVTDDGRGMSEEHRAQVFTPFFTTRAGGAGLGLASVRRVVAQHGGNVACDTHVGEGTRFTVVLPTAEPGAEAQPGAEPVRTKALKSLWIIEDQRMVRIVAERLLSGAGYAVRSFADPHRLLAALSNDVPELVLTDVVMPRMTGPALAQEIARRSPQARVLFMTGYADSLLDPYREELEGYELLRKPFTRDQLLSAVEEALKAK
ncbi:MAG: ATP-binding protein [Myxococcota bacterium]